MRIFKKAAVFLVAFFLVEQMAVFLLEPVTFAHFLSFDKKEAAREKETIDMAFFGDSRAIRTFYPDIFEEEMDGIGVVINEGVNQQHIASTYFYLKDYVNRYPLKYAVVNLNYDYFLNTTEDVTIAKGLTLDRIKSPFIAAEFIKERFSLREYPDVLKSYRYRHNMDEIFETAAEKLTPEYWKGIDTREDIHYVSKGYATWDLTYKQGNVGTPAGCFVWSEETVEPEYLLYLDKIAALCKEKNVQLYFVESPITVSRMYAIEGYREFDRTIREKCDALEVPFWNLNLLKEDNISVYDPNFTDTEHLNDKGSEKTSRLLASLLKLDMEGKDVSSFFYEDFDAFNEECAQIGSCDLFVWDADTQWEQIQFDKLGNKEPQKGQLVLLGSAYAAETITPLYCFSVTYDGGKTYSVLQDYSTEPVLIIDKEKLQKGAEFRIDTKPETGADLHHCYRTTLD